MRRIPDGPALDQSNQEFTMYFTPVSSALRARLACAPSVRSWDHSVERFLQHAFAAPARTAPAADASTGQDDKAYRLSLDLPGVAKEHLTVQIEANQVRVETLPEASRTYQVAYEFALNIDAASSEAKFENGVLTLKLAKQLPQSNAVKLAVN
jgi:HSP20 family protein